jgi:hypothetical protein
VKAILTYDEDVDDEGANAGNDDDDADGDDDDVRTTTVSTCMHGVDPIQCEESTCHMSPGH